MKRPMPIFTAFLILGIIWGSLGLTPIWFIAVNVIAFYSGFAFYHFFKLKFLILLPCLFALGYILCFNKASCSNQIYDEHCSSGNEIVLSAEVKGALGSGNIMKTSDNVKIIVYADEPLTLGSTVTLTGKLRALSPKYNPGDFDEIQYYRCRGIYYKMFYPEIEITGLHKSLPYYLSALRTKIATILDSIYSEENSAVLKAMLLGDKTYLSDEVKLLYKNSGIYHILAISGLHISLIAAGLMFIFRRKRHAAIIIAALSAYCIFTGLSPSTVRAVIMMSVFLFARIAGRKYDLVSSLAFSAFLILVVNPLYLFDCGFLYSYCSVLGIALFAKHFTRIANKIPPKNSKIKTYITASFATSLSAVIITKLLNMYFFYSVTTCDFITNLIVLPFIFIVILSGALSVLFFAVHLPIYYIFSATASFILTVYKYTAATVSSIPFSLITTGRPVFAFMVLYVLFLVFLYFSFKFKRKVFALGAVVFLVTGAVIHNYELSRDQVTFLYVGQGDGAIGTINGETFIVDGGGTKTEPTAADEGVYTLLPYLSYIGKTRVDKVFISHIDNDHMKGIYELIGSIEIGEIYLPVGSYSSELFTLLKDKAAENNIPINYISAGDMPSPDFLCIYPSKEQADNAGDINDGSMVLKATIGDKTILFTGDIGTNAENEIIKSDADIKADVLKVAHHGSKYSSSEGFLEAVSPSLAIISCGVNNVYGFPAEKTLTTLSEQDIPYFITSETGSVTLMPYSKGIKAKTALQKNIGDSPS